MSPRPTRLQKLLTFDWVLITLFLLTFFLVATLHWAQSIAIRTSDGSNLRNIVQCTLIYANEHNDQLPPASDIWDYARILAETDGLDSSSFWQSRADPAANPHSHTPVLTSNSSAKPRSITPAFRQVKPCFAVAIGSLHTTMPPTTPIAWTRGLQPDGTWSKHSPYAGHGGFILFLGGNSAFFKNLKTGGPQLTRFDGSGPTANILEALPPGTRISEYQPTPDEESAWHWLRLWRRYSGPDYEGFPLFWTPLLLCTLYRLLRKKRQVAQVVTTLGVIAALQLLLISLSD